MAAHQAPLGFSRQEHWSGLLFPSPMYEREKWKWSRSVVSDSQRPHGLQPSRLLRPRDFPGKSTGAGCHCLLCIGLLGTFKTWINVKLLDQPWHMAIIRYVEPIVIILEKEMATTTVFLPGESHGERSLAGLQSMGSQKVGHDWSDLTHTYIVTITMFSSYIVMLLIVFAISTKGITLKYLKIFEGSCYSSLILLLFSILFYFLSIGIGWPQKVTYLSKMQFPKMQGSMVAWQVIQLEWINRLLPSDTLASIISLKASSNRMNIISSNVKVQINIGMSHIQLYNFLFVSHTD